MLYLSKLTYVIKMAPLWIFLQLSTALMMLLLCDQNQRKSSRYLFHFGTHMPTEKEQLYRKHLATTLNFLKVYSHYSGLQHLLKICCTWSTNLLNIAKNDSNVSMESTILISCMTYLMMGEEARLERVELVYLKIRTQIHDLDDETMNLSFFFDSLLPKVYQSIISFHK